MVNIKSQVKRLKVTELAEIRAVHSNLVIIGTFFTFGTSCHIGTFASCHIGTFEISAHSNLVIIGLYHSHDGPPLGKRNQNQHACTNTLRLHYSMKSFYNCVNIPSLRIIPFA